MNTILHKSVINNYAQALVQLSKQSTTNPATLLNQAKQLLHLTSDPDIEYLLSHSYQKIQTLEKIIDKITHHELLSALLKLLAKKGELHLLSAILNQFIALNQSTILNATIITTHPLENTDYTFVQKSLENKYQKTIILTNKIDPSIIGGYILQIQGHQLDLSARNLIEQLNQHLKNTHFTHLAQ